MYKLNQAELDILIEALDMMFASNKRMQVAKPKFLQIFQQIATDITALKMKLLSTPTK